MDDQWCNGSKARPVVVVNHVEVWACKQLNSRWLIAESMTDDCLKANGILNPQPWCSWQAGAGGFVWQFTVTRIEITIVHFVPSPLITVLYFWIQYDKHILNKEDVTLYT